MSLSEVIVIAGKRPVPIRFFLCLENVFTFGSILKIYYVVQCNLDLVFNIKFSDNLWFRQFSDYVFYKGGYHLQDKS